MGRIASIEAEESEGNDDSTTSKVKKARAEAAQTARQAEQRDRDKERERARAEAAGRRQERAGRRRGDGESIQTEALLLLTLPDDPEETNATNSGSHSPPAPASSAPNSPSGSFVAPEKPVRKGGPGKKAKKLGNNQYTKNRDTAASSPHNRKRLLTSGGTSSGDEQAPNDMTSGSGQPPAQEATTSGVGKGRWGKKKGLNGMAFRNITSEPMERTIPNMARNLEGMVAFIQRAQLDVAEDRARTGLHGSPPQVASPVIDADGKSAMELADQLTRSIRNWQEKYRSQDTVTA